VDYVTAIWRGREGERERERRERKKNTNSMELSPSREAKVVQPQFPAF
jgi:hypothetical protein